MKFQFGDKLAASLISSEQIQNVRNTKKYIFEYLKHMSQRKCIKDLLHKVSFFSFLAN